MAKDTLSDALLGLKEVEKRRKSQQPKPRKIRRGRPKAFDPFYLFCTILLVLGIGLQIVAIALYA